MNITGLGSASWYTSQRSTTTSATGGSRGTTSTDSVAISPSGFAAMLQEQGGGPPELTDEQAAQIGSTLKEKHADLFAALDADEDGTLSAAEFKTGMEAMRGSQGPPPGPPPELSDEDAAAIGTDLQTANSSLFSTLDSDGDGTISADELRDGMDSLREAMDANGMRPPPPPEQSQRGSALSDYQTNLLNELLQSLAQT